MKNEKQEMSWTCAAKLAEWINEIAKEKHIPIGIAEVETKTKSSGKRSDIIIYETPQNVNILCVIECKLPFWDVYHEELKQDALKKAFLRKARYFCTCNFKQLIWWNTEKANNPTLTEERQIENKYLHFSEIENLDEIDNVRYREPIRRELEKFISKLYNVHTGKEKPETFPLDEHLVDRLHEKIRVLSYFYTDIIRDKFHKDAKFAGLLRNWFDEQMWEFSGTKNNFDRAARQTAYLLVNKILFYDSLQTKRPKELDPIKIPDSLTKGSLLQKTLQMYFDEVLKIDYETVYTTDFIDSIAFPDDEDLVKQIKELILILNQYNFGTLGYDILGRIFERLIPTEERHTLGQYFTSVDVVDLILRFCMKNENDKIFDPSCGAGTFLVRGYQHKKLMNQYKKHEEILETLWGNDISKFPAHLSTINLAINDLSVLKNYPNILQNDFFDLVVSPEAGCELETWRNSRAKTLGVDVREVTYPRYFDAIVGNPPYTRQEEMEGGSEKVKLIWNALKHGSTQIATLSKRAGIHAYFFVHGWKFLKNGGYFGFIVSNSWMDVDYGRGLQEFFLKHFKIIAIIDSEVERWFTDADVNTCIVILQKCSDEKERMNNSARFTLLKKPLRNFIPPAENEWSKQVLRKDEIDKLITTILSHSRFYENDDFRVFPVTQNDLWKEGTEQETVIPGTLQESQEKYGSDYNGAKWGKYLRAPKIFFKILEKVKDKLEPLNALAVVRRGFTTGANEFFYLSEDEIKRHKIEKEFLQPILFTLKEVDGYVLKKENLKYKTIVCHKQKNKLERKNILQYILKGEKQNYNKRPSCVSRSIWYSLGKGWDYAPLLFPAKIGKRMPVILNNQVFEDKKLYGIIPYNKNHIFLLGAILNSTYSRFYIEFTCRQLTGAQAIADIDVVVVETLLIPKIKILSKKTVSKLIDTFKNLCKTDCLSIFEELGSTHSSKVTLSKVKPERRALDKIIMGEILGLNEEEQLEVYRSVIHLVKQRIEKAKSTEKNIKFVEGIDIGMAKRDAVHNLIHKTK